MKQKLLKTIYQAGGFKPFHFLNRNEALILTYHRFSENSAKHSVSGGEFEAHLEYLKTNANVVSLNDFVRMVSTGEKFPANTTVITIDDGYKDAYDIAFPVLRKHKVPATLFVITDFVEQKTWLWTDLMRYILQETKADEFVLQLGNNEIKESLGCKDTRNALAGKVNEELKKMPERDKNMKISEIAESLNVSVPDVPSSEFAAINWDQALEMDRNGVTIESHTVTHPILTNIGASGLEAELEGSKTVLEQRLGRRVEHFCYPNGAYDSRVRDVVIAAGYVSAVTTKYGFCDINSGIHELKRIDAQPSIEHFAQSVSGFERMRERIGI